MSLHGAYQFGGADAVRALPGGQEWLGVIEKVPAAQRHLAVYNGHCVHLDEADDAAWDAGGSTTLRRVTLSGTRDAVRRRLDDYRARGATEIVLEPCGSDTERELGRFLEAASAQ